MPKSDANPLITEISGWRKSRHSNPNGECVQVAGLPDGQVAMRNSRRPSGEMLLFTRAEMTAFVLGAKDGEFDDLIND